MELSFTVPQRLFGPLALHELSQLSADVTNHFEKIAIRLPGLKTETFHDADDFVLEFNRKAESGAQSLLGRHKGSLNAADFGYVGDPFRLAAVPHAPRKAGARKKLALAGHRLELRDVDERSGPKFDAGQLVRSVVDVPYGAH